MGAMRTQKRKLSGQVKAKTRRTRLAEQMIQEEQKGADYKKLPKEEKRKIVVAIKSRLGLLRRSQ